MKRNTPSWRASRVKRNGRYLRAALAVACYALPGISSAGALECTQWQSRHPGWLWCDDFESDRDLENNYFEVNRAKGRLAVVAGPAYGGTHSLRNGYVTGMEEAGNIKLSIGKTPLHPMRYTDRNFDDLYWRFYLMTDAGWVGQPMKVTVVTTGWNDFPRLHWLGKANGRTQVYAPGNRGRWQCIEVHMQLNRPGRADGTFEFWVDGVPQAKKDNLDWRGDYTAYGINTITLEGWVNGGAPRDQNRYFDNFVVSTARIGCARS